MKILGIGNAIVDVICKVTDNFIDQNNLTKSTMKLFFDENEFKQLLTNLKIEKTVSGGSVANSIVGLSQLGDKVGFIGKVSDDDFGERVIAILVGVDMSPLGVPFAYVYGGWACLAEEYHTPRMIYVTFYTFA